MSRWYAGITLIITNTHFHKVSLLIEYGGDPEAKAKKRDIRGGDFLTCDQLAQEVGFANYEKVKTDALETKIGKAALAVGINRKDSGNKGKDSPEEESQVKTEDTALPSGGSFQEGQSNKTISTGVKLSVSEPTETEDVQTEKVDVKKWMKNYKQQKPKWGGQVKDKEAQSPSKTSHTDHVQTEIQQERDPQKHYQENVEKSNGSNDEKTKTGNDNQKEIEHEEKDMTEDLNKEKPGHVEAVIDIWKVRLHNFLNTLSNS